MSLARSKFLTYCVRSKIRACQKSMCICERVSNTRTVRLCQVERIRCYHEREESNYLLQNSLYHEARQKKKINYLKFQMCLDYSLNSIFLSNLLSSSIYVDPIYTLIRFIIFVFSCVGCGDRGYHKLCYKDISYILSLFLWLRDLLTNKTIGTIPCIT